MAYDRVSLLLRILGHFGASGTDVKDRWSTGIRIASIVSGTAPDGPFTPFLETVSVPIAAFHSGSNSLVGANCYLTELTMAKIGTDGKYSNPSAPTEHRLYDVPVAGVGTATQPWNTSLVTSLRTANPRGYASNGRCYYPAIAAPVSPATGRVVDANVLGRLQEFKTMVDAINVAANTLGSSLRVVVMSSVGAGASSKVTSLRADGRLDSIERRENQQPSSWSTVTIA